MTDKIKVRRKELMLINFLGIPVLRMLAKIFRRIAEGTDNEYDDMIADLFENLIIFLSGEDVFEIT